MGIVFRQSVKTILVTFTGALLGAMVLYLSTRYLHQQQYGFVRNLMFQAVVFSNLTLLGMHTTLYVFIHRYLPGDPRRPVLITLSLLAPLAMTLVGLAPYMLLKPFILSKYQQEDALLLSRFFLWTPVIVLLWSLLTLLEQYLSSMMKVALSNFFREVVLRICNLALIGLLALGWISFPVFVAAFVLTHLIPIGFLLWLALRTEGFRLSFQWHALSRKDYREIAHFAWYHILLNVSVSLMGTLDALMLAPLAGMKELAVYSVAGFIISMLQIPFRSMVHATTPVLTQAYHAHDHHKVADLFHRSALNILIVSTAMVALVVCNMHNAVAVLPAGYEAITPLVLILVLGRMTDIATGLNNELISVSKYYKFNFYLSVLLLVLLFSFNRVLIPKMGIYGAAWATTLAYTVFNVGKYVFVWWKMGLQPLSRGTALVLLSGGVAVAAGWLMPRLDQPILDAVLRSSLIAAVLGGMLLWLRPSPDMHAYLSAIRKNKRLF